MVPKWEKKTHTTAHVRYVVSNGQGVRLNQLTETSLRIWASKSSALCTTLEEIPWRYYFPIQCSNRYARQYLGEDFPEFRVPDHRLKGQRPASPRRWLSTPSSTIFLCPLETCPPPWRHWILARAPRPEAACLWLGWTPHKYITEDAI